MGPSRSTPAAYPTTADAFVPQWIGAVGTALPRQDYDYAAAEIGGPTEQMLCTPGSQLILACNVPNCCLTIAITVTSREEVILVFDHGRWHYQLTRAWSRVAC